MIDYSKELNAQYTDEQINDVILSQTSGMNEEEKNEFEFKLSETKKTLKGIKKSVVKNDINLQNYKNCVLDNTTKYDNMKTFRSYDHSVYTIDTKKMSLNSFDNKRFLVNNIDTLAHGHFSTLKGQTLMGQFGTFT